jgi:branched-chain amino acid transport system substrate-binding protein
LFAAVGYDLGLLVAEGLARAPELTRDGVREGLELVKLLPSAEGRAGTTLSFGHWDRGALHGPYLVLRQWRDTLTTEVGPR